MSTIDNLIITLERNLKIAICCEREGLLITSGRYYRLKNQYDTVVGQVGHLFEYRDQVERLRRLIKKVRCKYCNATFELPMLNFLDGATTDYPVGVFNVDGDFLGVANTQPQYLDLWNDDLANQAHGTLTAGDTPFSFRLPTTSPLTSVTGLRYYEYTGPANVQLFVGANDIVHYGSTIKKGNVDGVLITNTTRREWDRTLFGVGTGLKSTVVSDTVYTLNCTGYVDSASLKVFHNEDSEYAAVSHSNGFYTLQGHYPRALKAVYYAGRLATNYNAILNWDELDDLYSWYSFSVGGTVWGMEPNNFPDDLLTQNIKQLGVGEDTDGPASITTAYSFITATAYPILEDLAIAWNTGEALTGSEAWFLTMPKVTNLFIYKTQTITQVAAGVADAIWNNIGTALTGITPTGAVKELRVQRTNNITAASLAARTALTNAGWTVLTN